MKFFKQSDVGRIDIIFDRYDDISIKFESGLWCKGQIIKNIILSSHSTKIPADCKAFFPSTQCTQIKLQLVRYIFTNAPK